MQAAQVVPFHFESHEVRTLLIDDRPWFVATDVCDSLAIVNTARALSRLDDDERGVHSMNTLGGAQSLSVVNESGLYSLILTSRKAEAKRFKKWITAEVLPAIRKHGRYEDAANKMYTLVSELIGMSELNVIKGLIRDKAKAVSQDRRQGFQLVMHSRLHTRFNVPRTELIPAEQFEAACNFVAAYALEGEWLPKQEGIEVEAGLHRRYLISFGGSGERRISEIPLDACVMTYRELIKAVAVSGDTTSTDEMLEFAMAALHNLKARSGC
ncbi:hypothetical protein PS870_06476 [Pseudomonas fluorescens]|uniref:Bro-N domain-containing protein n=1 Tax=Pseudomonas fluorescens TaxID=294 RepID=A0A5E7QSL7_PSEFL|nr:Bro-N domain-containing protein [Pseudomonas fluorescens]VVP61913.1 hypothetical protein PS870_06476 [Pseudomonas fluorescens]